EAGAAPRRSAWTRRCSGAFPAAGSSRPSRWSVHPRVDDWSFPLSDLGLDRLLDLVRGLLLLRQLGVSLGNVLVDLVQQLHVGVAHQAGWAVRIDVGAGKGERHDGSLRADGCSAHPQWPHRTAGPSALPWIPECL